MENGFDTYFSYFVPESGIFFVGVVRCRGRMETIRIDAINQRKKQPDDLSMYEIFQ